VEGRSASEASQALVVALVAAMGIKDSEMHFLFMLLIGFAAFSMPLLMADAGLFTASEAPGPPESALYNYPPGPPVWHSYEDNDPGALFRRAVADGDLAKAEHLHEQSLNADPPVDLVTADQMYGQTPLFEAARSGHLTMARWLVAHGAQANKVNEWGDSAASEAASMGHWDIVWFLADSGADLTRKVEHAHSTLVLSAVRHKSLEALAELKRRGVDLNQRTWNGGTPLHEAARTGDAKIIEWCAHTHTHPSSFARRTAKRAQPAACALPPLLPLPPLCCRCAAAAASRAHGNAGCLTCVCAAAVCRLAGRRFAGSSRSRAST